MVNVDQKAVLMAGKEVILVRIHILGHLWGGGWFL